ncbi:MAG: protein kinase, partial [Chloroflexi bacterium]|nr:protein kinase [Chloroflexota bacterium]
SPDGPTLADSLAQRSAEEQPLPPLTALPLMQTIAEAMWAAEQAGLVHHDLTPESIILPQEDTGIIYDLVIPPEANPDLPQNYPEQTLTYQSPEQLAGQPPTIPGNIYAFGIMLYELLAGHRPELPTSEWDIFEHKGIPREIPLEEARPGLMPATYELVKNCIWQKEWSRYQSFSEVLAALETALAAEREGPPPPPVVPLDRRTLMIGGAILLVLLLLIGGFFVVRSLSGGDDDNVELFVPPTTAVLFAPVATAVPASTDLPPTATNSNTTENQPNEPAPAEAVPAENVATETATATITPSPTATETPTATSTPAETATATETAVPEETACEPSPPSGWVQYAIQEGDYLYNLAVNTGRTVERIQEVNCLTGNLLRLNQKIWLPRLPVHTATPPPVPSDTPDASGSSSTAPSQPPGPTSEPPTRTPVPPPTPEP